jgi:hypothetical protein
LENNGTYDLNFNDDEFEVLDHDSGGEIDGDDGSNEEVVLSGEEDNNSCAKEEEEDEKDLEEFYRWLLI